MIHDASKCEFGERDCEGTGGRAGHMCSGCAAKVQGSVFSLQAAREKRLPVAETRMEEAMIDCGVFIANMVELGMEEFEGSFDYKGKTYHLALMKCLHNDPEPPKRGA